MFRERERAIASKTSIYVPEMMSDKITFIKVPVEQDHVCETELIVPGGTIALICSGDGQSCQYTRGKHIIKIADGDELFAMKSEFEAFVGGSVGIGISSGTLRFTGNIRLTIMDANRFAGTIDYPSFLGKIQHSTGGALWEKITSNVRTVIQQRADEAFLNCMQYRRNERLGPWLNGVFVEWGLATNSVNLDYE